jgi:hypothetical protein
MSEAIENNPGFPGGAAEPKLLGWKLMAAKLITEPQPWRGRRPKGGGSART